jgi:hypothetical protein
MKEFIELLKEGKIFAGMVVLALICVAVLVWLLAHSKNPIESFLIFAAVFVVTMLIRRPRS